METRRLGLAASACALVSAVLLVAAIPLNERAVRLENGVTGDSATYALAFAVLLALVASSLSLRFGVSAGRRILEGAGQGEHIIIDARRQSGLTYEVALRAIGRAYGAVQAGRITLIRIIGAGFDISLPPPP